MNQITLELRNEGAGYVHAHFFGTDFNHALGKVMDYFTTLTPTEAEAITIFCSGVRVDKPAPVKLEQMKATQEKKKKSNQLRKLRKKKK